MPHRPLSQSEIVRCGYPNNRRVGTLRQWAVSGGSGSDQTVIEDFHPDDGIRVGHKHAVVQETTDVNVGKRIHRARRQAVTQFDLPQMLMTIVNDYADRQIELRYHGPAHAMYKGQPLALKRAITNLVENALKYATPPSPDPDAAVQRHAASQ